MNEGAAGTKTVRGGVMNIKWGWLVIGASIFFTGYFLAKIDGNRKAIDELNAQLLDELNEPKESEKPDDFINPFLLRALPEDCQSDSQNVFVPPRREAPEQWRLLFMRAGKESGLPYEILESIAFVESGFNPDAVSPRRKNGHRDRGMFQFNSRYQRWYEKTYNGGKPFDPMKVEEAIRITALHVKWLYERYGNWPDVFLAYNAGVSRVDSGDIPEGALDYLNKIYMNRETS